MTSHQTGRVAERNRIIDSPVPRNQCVLLAVFFCLWNIFWLEFRGMDMLNVGMGYAGTFVSRRIFQHSQGIYACTDVGECAGGNTNTSTVQSAYILWNAWHFCSFSCICIKHQVRDALNGSRGT